MKAIDYTTERTFGIEIELTHVKVQTVISRLARRGVTAVEENYNHRISTNWKFVTDSSICSATGKKPRELVSPILCGAAGLAQIETVLQVLRETEAEFDNSCGIHVHIGAKDFKMHNWKFMIKKYLKHEGLLTASLPANRRSNYFCSPVRSSIADNFFGYNAPVSDIIEKGFAAIDAAVTLSDIKRGLGITCRYSALNLESFTKYGTVEFRAHHATLDAQEVLCWVSSLVYLLDSCRRTNQKSDITGADDAKKLFATTSKSLPTGRATLISHFEARKVKYAA